MTLKIQLIMLVVVAISFCLGFFLGKAWAKREYEGPVRKVRALENFKRSAEALCPKLTSGMKKDEEETELAGGYLPKFKRAKRLRSLMKDKSCPQNKTGPQFEVTKRGNPEDA